jgi:hypothetical protein
MQIHFSFDQKFLEASESKITTVDFSGLLPTYSPLQISFFVFYLVYFYIHLSLLPPHLILAQNIPLTMLHLIFTQQELAGITARP